MTKNKTEKMFRESFKANSLFWGMKLHNNPLTHQNTPADFILDYQKVEDISLLEEEKKLKVILVECKQITCQESKGRLQLKRLKQMHDLLAFVEKRPDYHKAYFLIVFYDKRWNNSDIYLIPVHRFNNFIMINWDKVSMNREDFRNHLLQYSVFIKNGLMNLEESIWNL